MLKLNVVLKRKDVDICSELINWKVVWYLKNNFILIEEKDPNFQVVIGLK